MREWTDQELDDALAALHADVRTDESAAARARSDLMTAVVAGDGPAPARWSRWAPWAAAAAAVAVLAGGALVVRGGAPEVGGQVASATELLDRSAVAVRVAGDPVVEPGQYLRVEDHGWFGVAIEGTWTYLAEQRSTMWIPADRAGEWLWRRTTTGEVRWLDGDLSTLPPGSPDPTRPTSEDLRAAGGRFYGEAPPEGWDNPTPEFVAGLPHDPDLLYERLAVDPAGGPAPRWTTLDNAATALRTGLLPADLRAALHEALARVPEIRVVDGRVDLDGRIGVGLGVTDDLGFVHEIIIDPGTGRFLGERNTDPTGRELGTSAVTVDVVDRPGD